MPFFPPGGSGSGGFGSDTIVDIKNGSGTAVHALEMQTSLTVTTAASEASKVVIKTLLAGSQVNGLEVFGDHVVVPAGATPAAGVNYAGMTFQGSGKSGVWWDPTSGGSIVLGTSSTSSFRYDSSGNVSFGTGGAAVLFAGWDGGARGLLTVTGGYLQMFGLNAAADVIIGARAAVLQNRTGGFLSLPAMAGPPSGVPSIATDWPHVIPMQPDDTNRRLYMYWPGTGWTFIQFP